MSGMKHQNCVLKSVKIRKHITLLSDANVPVRFREQQRAKYCSLQLTANCIAVKGCLRHYSNWFENHRPQRTQISTVTNAPFHSKLELNGPQVDRNRRCAPSVFFQLLQYSRQHPSFLAHWGALITKTDLTYWGFSSMFVHSAVQFWFCYKFPFHEKQLALE